MNIFVVGYPKTGTLWLARLLGDALDSPITTTTPKWVNGLPTEGLDRSGKYFIRHGHAMPKKHMQFYATGDKIVRIVRDPRDVVVSSKYYWEYKTIRESMDHIVSHKEAGGISANYMAWLRHPKVTVATSYEALLKDTELELGKILADLEVDLMHNICEAVQRQSFAKRKAWTKVHGDELVFGKDVQLQYLRKGVVGDWVNHFTHEDGLYMHGVLGDLMVKFGYIELAERWWEILPHA